MPPCAKDDDKGAVRRRLEKERPSITLAQLHEHHKPEDMWIGTCRDSAPSLLATARISLPPAPAGVCTVCTMLLCMLQNTSHYPSSLPYCTHIYMHVSLSYSGNCTLCASSARAQAALAGGPPAREGG